MKTFKTEGSKMIKTTLLLALILVFVVATIGCKNSSSRPRPSTGYGYPGNNYQGSEGYYNSYFANQKYMNNPMVKLEQQKLEQETKQQLMEQAREAQKDAADAAFKQVITNVVGQNTKALIEVVLGNLTKPKPKSEGEEEGEPAEQPDKKAQLLACLQNPNCNSAFKEKLQAEGFTEDSIKALETALIKENHKH